MIHNIVFIFLNISEISFSSFLFQEFRSRRHTFFLKQAGTKEEKKKIAWCYSSFFQEEESCVSLILLISVFSWQRWLKSSSRKFHESLCSYCNFTRFYNMHAQSDHLDLAEVQGQILDKSCLWEKWKFIKSLSVYQKHMICPNGIWRILRLVHIN